MRKPITLHVRDAENILFEGEVDRISSFNEVGRFDIFPMHANFISIIKQTLVLCNKHQVLKEIKVEQAIMKVKQDIATIYIGIEALVIDDENSQEKTDKEQSKK